MISSEQAADLIQRSRTRARGADKLRIAGLMLASVGVWLLVTRTGAASLLDEPAFVMMLLFCGLSFWTWRQAAAQRDMLTRLAAATEAMQLHEYPRAEEAVCALLAVPVRQPSVRAEGLLMVAALAEQDHHFETAQLVYESMLTDGQVDPAHHAVATIGLAGALIRNAQLTDAVTLIDRLLRADLPGKLRAHVELLALYREITMGQTDHALEHADRRRILFREHLSTRAGYGYGLLAVACARGGQHERAAALWRDATTLVTPARLVHQFDEIKEIADRLPATESPFADDE